MNADHTELIDRLASFDIDEEDLRFRDEEVLRDHLYALEGIEARHIGWSRDAREMHGVRFGDGPRQVSLIAGCHADEPIGPMTAQILPRLLRRHFPEVLESFQFSMVPQMNPDGAEVNREWFSKPPDLGVYLARVKRGLPGDDIEFGFGAGAGIRPECKAAQAFLRLRSPYVAHFSLHGMAWAEGSWCLLSKEWAERAAPFMDQFAVLCAKLEFPLHDIDRKGEKGFERIRPGFCTTPNSEAMRAFFEARGDKATARKFQPSSMEWIRSVGGDSLCVVSEVPLFLMGVRSKNIDDPLSSRLTEDVAVLTPDVLAEKYRLSPVSIELQVRLQTAMVVLALKNLS